MIQRLRYPTSLVDFHGMFPDEEHAAAYLFDLRYPDGQPCPGGCGSAFTLYQGGRVIRWCPLDGARLVP